MNFGVPYVLVSYLGLSVAGLLTARTAPRATKMMAARGAWLAGFLVVAWDAAIEGEGPACLSRAVAPVAWAYSAGMLQGAPWFVPTVVVGSVGCTWAASRVSAVSILLAMGLVHAMRTSRLRTWRFVAYAVSFSGTFVGILPWATSFARPTILFRPAWGVAGVLAAAALALFVAGCSALMEAGGTPEPIDPPTKLCTKGLYEMVRHPIQLAEVLAVWSMAFARGTEGAVWFALGFTVALFGPVRVLEERRLALRFGPAYAAYRRRVPAYLPGMFRPGAPS